MVELDRIYNEDCLSTLGRIEDNSIDLIVTSPPYNKGFYADKNARQSKIWSSLNGRKIAYDAYDDDMEPEMYEKWQTDVIRECIRVLKPTGSMFYNHKDVISKGLIVPPKWVYGFKVKQQIIWNIQSSPMCDQHYFMPAHEWLYWIVKDESKVFFDKSKSLYRTTIWNINRERSEHPAPFPTKMVRNIIACCSKEQAVVYDPFMGGGTTAVCVIREGLGRKFIGSEISEKICRYGKFFNKNGKKSN